MEEKEDIKLAKYYEDMSSAMKEERVAFFENGDCAHNAVFMRLLFEGATTINMFCGQMSVFRNGFYKHIEECYGEDMAKESKQGVIDGFKKFVNRADTSMNIIFESFEKEYVKDLIFDLDFLLALSDGKITMRKLSNNFLFKEDLKHFCYSMDGRMLRLERDKISHSGICIFKKDKSLQTANSNFERLKRHSTVVVL